MAKKHTQPKTGGDPAKGPPFVSNEGTEASEDTAKLWAEAERRLDDLHAKRWPRSNHAGVRRLLNRIKDQVRRVFWRAWVNEEKLSLGWRRFHAEALGAYFGHACSKAVVNRDAAFFVELDRVMHIILHEGRKEMGRRTVAEALLSVALNYRDTFGAAPSVEQVAEEAAKLGYPVRPKDLRRELVECGLGFLEGRGRGRPKSLPEPRAGGSPVRAARSERLAGKPVLESIDDIHEKASKGIAKFRREL